LLVSVLHLFQLGKERIRGTITRVSLPGRRRPELRRSPHAAAARAWDPGLTGDWHGLDLRHLAALRAIAEQGSFKDAAQALGYTPSAISQQITSLERTIGSRVVAREHGRRALGLTEAGLIMLRHLNAIEARLDAARTEITALEHGLVGPIRIEASESIAARFLPDVLRRFRAERPNVEIVVDETPFDPELELLERGAHDVAFGVLPLPEGPFEATVVLTDPWVLVAEAGSPLLRRGTLRTLRELRDVDVIASRSTLESPSCLNCLRAAGVNPSQALSSESDAVVQAFAAAGLGVAVMPRLAVSLGDDRIGTVELGELIPPRRIAVAWHADRTPHPSLETFVALVARAGSQLERLRAVDAPPSGRLLARHSSGLRYIAGAA
jgi:molybdate transport repressor ModE-like protein